MIYRTEKNIMEKWIGNIDQVIVSICCITYNHESYISKAIDGFLMQETDFPFEILINDDCSTDNTKKIIKKYEEKYPNIIKPIYQKENQFIKGIKMNPTFNFTRAKGSYIAMCEGDDYWTDKKKLDIQINEMRKFPEINMSFHPASELLEDKIGKTLNKYAEENKIFTTSEVILGSGGFSPTASLIFTKESVCQLPQWFYQKAPVGDYFLQIFGSLNGGALYISRVMSIYRREHLGSWSNNKIKNSNTKIADFIGNQKKISNSFNDTMKDLDIYTNNKYTNEINMMIMERLFTISLIYLEYKEYDLFSESQIEIRNIYKSDYWRHSIVYNFRKFPRLLRNVNKLRKILSKSIK